MNRYRILVLDAKSQETEKLTEWVMWSRAVDAFHGLCDQGKVAWSRAEETLLNLFARDSDLVTIRMPDDRIVVIVRAP